jgi:catechol 2,3-dioxygenase-like lactoylglutathione lyase family enzyme
MTPPPTVTDASALDGSWNTILLSPETGKDGLLPMATVRYFAKDVSRAADFYVQHLGFQVQQQFGPAIALLSDGDLDLWIAGPPASASRPMPNGDVPEPGGWNRLVIRTDDLDALIAKLRPAGVTFRNDIVSGPGGRQILIEDSEGNPIELFEAG